MAQQAPLDLRLAFAPRTTYRRLAASPGRGGWADVCARLALAALLLGVCVAIGATGRVSPALLLSTTVAWSWIPLVQLLIAMAMIGSAPRQSRPPLDGSVALWFAAHLPWTAWLLALAPVLRLFPTLEVETLLLSMLLPMAWTMGIVAIFCRVVLQRPAGESWLRALAHQLCIAAVVLSYVAWSAGGWFRLVE